MTTNRIANLLAPPQAPESPMSVAFREYGEQKLQEGFENGQNYMLAKLPAIVEAAREQGRESRSILPAMVLVALSGFIGGATFVGLCF